MLSCFYLFLYLQVFQQALHRQPNTAAQYLQQMYAAQQQHLMLQTAALQQQHSLSTAQLQSLAAVQQVRKPPSDVNHSDSLAMRILLLVTSNKTFLRNCTFLFLPLVCSLVTGQHRGWSANLLTEWHFISADGVHSDYGRWSCECGTSLITSS